MGVSRVIRQFKRNRAGASQQLPVIEPAILNDIEQAQCRVMTKNLETVHPNMELIQKMIKITENYIKEHKRIVYGGTAIEAYLEAKGVSIYHDPSKYLDYDFYTPNNEQDSIAIANLFQDAGFKYSRRVLAIHAGTYRVSAEFTKEFIADASFVPQKEFDKLPKCDINGILYIDPQFLKIDLYTSVSNPHTNIFRWEKSYKRLIQLEELYPLKITKQVKVEPQPPKQALIIEKYSKSNDNIIIVGTQAYNLYNPKDPQPVNVYSFYTLNPEAEANKIKKKVKGLTLVNHYPYLDIFSRHTDLTDSKGKLVAEWYDIALDCVAVTEINRYNVANYHWLLRFLYGKLASTQLKGNYGYLINSLMKAHTDFNNLRNLHRRDETNPFKIFQIECIKNTTTQAQSQSKPKDWSYKPDKEKRDSKDVKTNYENNLLNEVKN